MTRSARIATVAIGLALIAGCGTRPAGAPAATPTKPTATASTRSHPQVLSVTAEQWRLPYSIAREAVIPAAAGSVIVGGGMFPDDSSSARAFRLDLASGRATMLPSLGVDVHDVAGGLYAGEPAIFGGGNASEQSIVQQFHGGAWRVVTHMPTTRSDLSVAVVGSTTYVLGGYDGAGVPTQVLSQSGSSPLRAAGRLTQGVRYAATAVLGSSIYLFGGEVSGAELGVVQRYDTGTHRTTVVAHLPVPLGHASAVVLGGRILLVGGRIHPDGGTRAMWWFDPATARFTRAGSLPLPVTDAAVAVAPDGRSAWLLGGEAPHVRDGVLKLSLS
ncbi:MAG: Kelch repeat-containing protein [Marmoricola sp.]